MSDNEKELKRILYAYIELSSQNFKKAIDIYQEKCNEIIEIYKKQYNDNINKT